MVAVTSFTASRRGFASRFCDAARPGDGCRITRVSGQSLADNPNWKGGRSIASNGYVLVKNPHHPLADIRGYVYEHRVVAEGKIGRYLLPGEEVHHINHDKADNRPENLMVAASHAHHRREHRRLESGLREPGEDNPQVVCLCGCGAEFPKYDATGRPRKILSGHNNPRLVRQLCECGCGGNN